MALPCSDGHCAGSAMRGSDAGPPASISPTVRSGSSLRRAASTEPALPEPTTRKSNQLSDLACIPSEPMTHPGGYCFHFFGPESMIGEPKQGQETRTGGWNHVVQDQGTGHHPVCGTG